MIWPRVRRARPWPKTCINHSPSVPLVSVRGFLILRSHGQPDQPGWSGPEAARTEIERGQILAEVDVQPLAARRPRVPDGMSYQRGGDAFPLMAAGDLGIEKERVIAAVPHHIDEPNQALLAGQASGHPAQTVGPDLIPPASHGATAMCLNEHHHFRISDRTAPAILNRLG